METVLSKNNILIRLTDERWSHITEEHSEVAGMRFDILETVKYPERILQGHYDEFLAIRKATINKYIVVIYKELINDGFIITAFLTKRINSLNKRRQLWPLN